MIDRRHHMTSITLSYIFSDFFFLLFSSLVSHIWSLQRKYSIRNDYIDSCLYICRVQWLLMPIIAQFDVMWCDVDALWVAHPLISPQYTGKQKCTTQQTHQNHKATHKRQLFWNTQNQYCIIEWRREREREKKRVADTSLASHHSHIYYIATNVWHLTV